MPRSTRTTEIKQKYAFERNRIIADIESIDAKLNALSTSQLDSAMTQKKAHLDDLIHDQVYRFAGPGLWITTTPTTMTAKQLNIFCFVWFGAIAFVSVSEFDPAIRRVD